MHRVLSNWDSEACPFATGPRFGRLHAPPASGAAGGILPVLWAMAARVPIVAAATVVAGELIDDGKTGLLYEPGDLHGAARRVLELLEHPVAATGLARRAGPWSKSGSAPIASRRSSAPPAATAALSRIGLRRRPKPLFRLLRSGLRSHIGQRQLGCCRGSSMTM